MGYKYLTVSNILFCLIASLCLAIIVARGAQFVGCHAKGTLLVGCLSLGVALVVCARMMYSGYRKSKTLMQENLFLLEMPYDKILEVYRKPNKCKFIDGNIGNGRTHLIKRIWCNLKSNQYVTLLFDRNNICVSYKVEWVICSFRWKCIAAGCIILFMFPFFLENPFTSPLLFNEYDLDGFDTFTLIILFAAFILLLGIYDKGIETLYSEAEVGFEYLLLLSYDEICKHFGQPKNNSGYVYTYYEDGKRKKGFEVSWYSLDNRTAVALQRIILYFDENSKCIEYRVIDNRD